MRICQWESRSKTITHRRFRPLFGNCFNANKKKFLRKYVTMDKNIDPPLHSRVKSAVSWVDSNRWKPSQNNQRHKHQQAKFLPLYFGMHKVFLFYWLPWKRKNTINSEYHIALLVCLKEEESPKNGHKWRRKKCCFHLDKRTVTSRSQRWQNYMICTSNCFRTHLILQICLSEITCCLQTSKECSRERDLAPMKKWYCETEAYFEVKDKSF